MDQQSPRQSLLGRPLVRGVIAAGLLAILTGGVVIGQALRGGSDPTLEGRPATTGTVEVESGIGALDSNPPIIGSPAPNFVLRDLDGNRVTLTDYRGSVVWINFWATWCTPCKKELPEIEALLNEKRGAGLVVLAINYRERHADARAFMDNAGLTLPVLLDRGGSVYDQYRLQGLPNSFFVGRDGNLAALQYGYMTEKKMRERLRDAGME